jgi:hypothetical protein
MVVGPDGAGTLPPSYGRSTEPLPDSGDALRAKLEVEFGGERGRLFLFSGTRIRFGRNRARAGKRENDLLLRAFPSGSEDPAHVRQRTRNVSGHHGTFVLTRDGVAVRDDGSTLGTKLDGRPLPPHELVPLGDEFLLEVADSIGLRGRVLRVGAALEGRRALGLEAAHPVAAVRLERTRDGEHHSYVLLFREVGLGSGPDDALTLPHEGVLAGHARVGLLKGRLVLAASREDGSGSVSGFGRLAPGVFVDLQPGAEIHLGEARLRFSLVEDDDMKPD